jgi:hypothetical protein
MGAHICEFMLRSLDESGSQLNYVEVLRGHVPHDWGCGFFPIQFRIVIGADYPLRRPTFLLFIVP